MNIMKRVYFFIFLISGINILFADGFIIIHNIPQRENPFPLEVKEHYVDVDINELTATTNISQIFYNVIVLKIT